MSPSPGRPAARRPSPAGAASVVIAACAASAGAHAALVPAHLDDERALGLAFAAATAVLLAVVIASAARPDSRATGRVAAAVLASLIGAYVLSVTTGIPWLVPAPEPVDAIGLATKSVEALGLAFALQLIPTTGGRGSPNHEEARR